MIYFNLFASFFKIGLFSFGGGYAMLPLIQKEIEYHNWLTAQQFVDIIAVAESTPGPVAINAATFIGFKTGGFFGSLVSTIGVCLPAFILVVIITKIAEKHKEHPIMKGVLKGVRPVVISLISLAAIFVGRTVLISPAGYLGIDWISVAIALVGFFAMIRFKIHPVILVVLSAFIGIFVY